jgi:hypothetical protein
MRLSESPLLEPFLGRSAIIDSNLLLVYWCCRFNPSLLRSFKRLNGFEQSDLFLLSETLRLFSPHFTTPHILTEVSNLTTALPSWLKDGWFSFFSEQIRLIPEMYERSSEIAANPAAIRFGLTDAALIRLAGKHLVITIDWPLIGFLEAHHLPVLNFNVLREMEFSL